MSGIFGIGGGQQPAPGDDAPRHQELRLGVRTTRLGEGTLACPDCDAPVQPPAYPAAVTAPVACSWCGRSGPLRSFLSLASPARPTRVVVRVRMPSELLRGDRRITIEPRLADD